MPESEDDRPADKLGRTIVLLDRLSSELNGKLGDLEVMRDSLVNVRSKVEQLHKVVYEGNGQDSITVRLSRLESCIESANKVAEERKNGCPQLLSLKKHFDKLDSGKGNLRMILVAAVVSSVCTALLSGVGWLIVQAFLKG